MKMQGFLFKKQEKVTLKLLKYNAFSFHGLSHCHGAFYLVFNVVLSKEK